MKIINALVYMPDHTFLPAEINIKDGRIDSVIPVSARKSLSCPTSADDKLIDAGGAYAIPGLVDIHFHGAAGHDMCDADPEGLQVIADYEAEHGILAICPATMTLPESALAKVMSTAASHRNGHGADLVGINMEGPFVSPKKAGAQDPEYIVHGDAAMFRQLMSLSNNLIKIIDIAPEEPGNMDLIREIHREVRISLAHTCTDYDTARTAFNEGAVQMTHLFNAMPGIHHRMPGPVPAAIECGAAAELIADGIHVHPSIVRLAFRAFGAEKIILISDSIMATGMPDGEYRLAGQKVKVTGKKAVLAGQEDTLAGSVTNLYDCMRNAIINIGIPPEEAIWAASENPARAIGIDKDYGSLRPGCYGNVILADKDLSIKSIIQKGTEIVRSS